ncbi:hypothetical protein Q7P37_009915 [Cladosporium fusiforme]
MTHNIVFFLVYFLSVWCVSAHTWIEQLQVIGANGSYTGDFGYARGFVDRADPRFDGFSNKWQIPDPATGERRLKTEMQLCHPSQRRANYSSQYPRLRVAPGEYVAMKYLENGHVTIPWDPKGKPKRGGTVWAYGTHDPRPTETLFDVLQWNGNSSGGDGRGRLLAAQDFDDGRCHQLNGVEESRRRQSQFPNHFPDQPDVPVEQWCETDVKIPDDITVHSTLTIYWVWGWETAPGSDHATCGKDEYYVSCLDVEVRRKTDTAELPEHKLDQQDPQRAAVHNYQKRSALRKEPLIITEDNCNPEDTSISAKVALPSGTMMGSLQGKLREDASRNPLLLTVENTTSKVAYAGSTSCSDAMGSTITLTSTTTATKTITLG